jgi:hypothetical protein
MTSRKRKREDNGPVGIEEFEPDTNPRDRKSFRNASDLDDDEEFRSTPNWVWPLIKVGGVTLAAIIGVQIVFYMT